MKLPLFYLSKKLGDKKKACMVTFGIEFGRLTEQAGYLKGSILFSSFCEFGTMKE